MPPALRPRRLGSVPVRGHVAIEPPAGADQWTATPLQLKEVTIRGPDFITLRDQSSERWPRISPP
jgi:hypothetical protein